MSIKKPLPSKQLDVSTDYRYQEAELPERVKPLNKSDNRATRRSVKGDKDFPRFDIGLKDIDETIVYYFNNVIQPSVIQNSKKLNVPILYGSPERWAAVQKDGFYRDKNGKIQAPLIMFKRDSIEKNRSLGNKLDANSPNNFQIFEKKYSKESVYDRFSILNNREPVKEYYGVIIPDYVNLVYSCIVFTDYIEQMNKIVESINFASDSYWGDPERFRFRAMIDSYTTATELSQGEDRKVRTEFNINMLGYIIPDSINSQINGMNKTYSLSSVSFKLETVSNLDDMITRSRTPERQASRRFFDQAFTGAQQSGTTAEQRVYLSTNNTFIADTITTNTATFNNRSFATPPSGYTVDTTAMEVEVNGIRIATSNRSIAELGSNIVVTFDTDNIGYVMDSGDEITITGKVE